MRRARHLAIAVSSLLALGCRDTSSPGRPALDVRPASVVLRPGQSTSLAIVVRDGATRPRFLVVPLEGTERNVRVDSVGTITALEPGLATVVVSVDTGGGDAERSVSVNVAGIRVFPVPVAVGAAARITARVFLPVGQNLTTAQATRWQSSNDAILTALSEGADQGFAIATLHGLAPGAVNVTVTANADSTIRATIPIIVSR